MLIKKSEARKKQNNKDCTVWEYEFPTKEFNHATTYIHGRYPEHAKAMNKNCEEIYFVISGSGSIHSEKGNFEINEGDAYFFEKGEIYWVEGKELLLTITNAPKWNPQQHKMIE